MGRTVQIRGASRDSLVSCFTYMGSDPWLTHLSSSRPFLTLRRKSSILRRLCSDKRMAHAVNKHPPDQGGSLGSGIHREDTGQLSNGACGCHQEEKGATPGDDPWVGLLVQC